MTKIGETLCNKYPRSQAQETSSGERKGQKCQMLLMCEDWDWELTSRFSNVEDIDGLDKSSFDGAESLVVVV